MASADKSLHPEIVDDYQDASSSCLNDPNYAIICVFLQKFGSLLKIEHPDFLRLQKMIENTDEGKAKQKQQQHQLQLQHILTSTPTRCVCVCVYMSVGESRWLIHYSLAVCDILCARCASIYVCHVCTCRVCDAYPMASVSFECFVCTRHHCMCVQCTCVWMRFCL